MKIFAAIRLRTWVISERRFKNTHYFEKIGHNLVISDAKSPLLSFQIIIIIMMIIGKGAGKVGNRRTIQIVKCGRYTRKSPGDPKRRDVS